MFWMRNFLERNACAVTVPPSSHDHEPLDHAKAGKVDQGEGDESHQQIENGDRPRRSWSRVPGSGISLIAQLSF